MLTDTRKSPNARLQGLPFSDVEWTHGLYKERFDTCAGSTVPHLQNMFERREISHVLENFKMCIRDRMRNCFRKDGYPAGEGGVYGLCGIHGKRMVFFLRAVGIKG